jgi:hypothetical protein
MTTIQQVLRLLMVELYLQSQRVFKAWNLINEAQGKVLKCAITSKWEVKWTTARGL